MARQGRHRRKPTGAGAPKPPQRVTVSIDAIGAQGEGVATFGEKRIYTPLTAPGDVAVIDLSGDHGVLVGLQQESPHRAQPSCRHYGVCGGCALQHVDDDFQRDWKRQRVVSVLARVGLADPADTQTVAQTVTTPAASRRRATFAVQRARGAVVLGFNMRRSKEIVALEDCRVLHPDLLTRLEGLRDLSRRIDAPAFDMAVTLCENGLDIEISGRTVNEPVGPALESLISAARAVGAVRVSINRRLGAMLSPPLVRFGGVAVIPPHGAFVQASREGEAALTKLAIEACAGARRIADLFAGCGAFALPLARCASVYAADSAPAAIGALSDGAGRAQGDGMKINPVRTEVRDLFERPLSAAELNAFDAVVFDPPRAGAAAQAGEIARCKAPLVVGVSCNPATFARDARILADGGYTLAQATPVDQFVYSTHVEIIGVFRRE